MKRISRQALAILLGVTLFSLPVLAFNIFDAFNSLFKFLTPTGMAAAPPFMIYGNVFLDGTPLDGTEVIVENVDELNNLSRIVENGGYSVVFGGFGGEYWKNNDQALVYLKCQGKCITIFDTTVFNSSTSGARVDLIISKNIQPILSSRVEGYITNNGKGVENLRVQVLDLDKKCLFFTTTSNDGSYSVESGNAEVNGTTLTTCNLQKGDHIRVRVVYGDKNYSAEGVISEDWGIRLDIELGGATTTTTTSTTTSTSTSTTSTTTTSTIPSKASTLRIELYGDYDQKSEYSGIYVDGRYIGRACYYLSCNLCSWSTGLIKQIDVSRYCSDGILKIDFVDRKSVNYKCNAIHKACILINGSLHCCEKACESKGCNNSIIFRCSDWSCLEEITTTTTLTTTTTTVTTTSTTSTTTTLPSSETPGYDECNNGIGWSEPTYAAKRCGWPPGSKGYIKDCCCCFIKAHIHDLRGTFKNRSVLINYRPAGGFGNLIVYSSLDGNRWRHVGRVNTPSKKKNYNATIKVPYEFRYIKLKMGWGRSIDWSSVKVLPTENHPVEGNLSVEPRNATIGEKIKITVMGRDYDGMEKIAAYYHGSWHFYYCNNTVTCKHTWEITENTTGSKVYWGYVYGKKPDGTIESKYTTPQYVIVFITQNGTCLKHGESTHDPSALCCLGLKLKEDLWSTPTNRLYTCCYPSECSQDGICVPSGTEYPDWGVKCEQGNWINITTNHPPSVKILFTNMTRFETNEVKVNVSDVDGNADPNEVYITFVGGSGKWVECIPPNYCKMSCKGDGYSLLCSYNVTPNETWGKMCIVEAIAKDKKNAWSKWAMRIIPISDIYQNVSILSFSCSPLSSLKAQCTLKLNGIQMDKIYSMYVGGSKKNKQVYASGVTVFSNVDEVTVIVVAPEEGTYQLGAWLFEGSAPDITQPALAFWQGDPVEVTFTLG